MSQERPEMRDSKESSEPGESVFTRLYFVSAKLRAISFFLENGLMREEIVPADVEQIKTGAGLLLSDLSREVSGIGQTVERAFDKCPEAFR